MKKILFAVLAAAALTVLAETYTSAGFCAQIDQNGIVRDLTCNGQKIMNIAEIYGKYLQPVDAPFHTTEFWQSDDSVQKAKFTRKGEKLIVKQRSTMGNKQYPKALEYELEVILEPRKIFWRYSVVPKVPFRVEIRSRMEMTSVFFGKPLKYMAVKKNIVSCIVPTSFESRFAPFGWDFTFTADKKDFRIKCDDDTLAFYHDGRSSGKNYFELEFRQIMPATKENPGLYWGCMLSVENQK